MVPTYVAEAVDNGASLVFFGPKIPEQKFVRDPLNRDDIEGAKAKNKEEKRSRETMKIDDIEGAKPMIPYLAKERKNKLNSLDYRDVTVKKTH